MDFPFEILTPERFSNPRIINLKFALQLRKTFQWLEFSSTFIHLDAKNRVVSVGVLLEESHPWMGNVLKEAKYKATCYHYVTLGYLLAFGKCDGSGL